jgi:hypothetical protein
MSKLTAESPEVKAEKLKRMGIANMVDKLGQDK